MNHVRYPRSAFARCNNLKPSLYLTVFLLVLATSGAADTIPTISVDTDTTLQTLSATDSSTATNEPAMTDSLLTTDSVGTAISPSGSTDTSSLKTIPVSTAQTDTSESTIPAPPNPAIDDTVNLNDGYYLTGGIGWSLGDFALATLWENALPDSLEALGLTDSSFRMQIDSTADITPHMSDTALLQFSIKEKPTIYTMCFPITVSLLNITGTSRYSLALIGSWMQKVNTTAIGLRNDTTHLQCDYKESLNIFSLFLSATYGRAIPTKYFTIDGIQKCFFVLGLDFSPLIATTISTSIKIPAGNQRLENIKHHLQSSDRLLHGGAAALRIGLSMVKRINKNSATDAGFYYTIQGYGIFYEDGKRVAFNDIDPADKKNDRPLLWISNRFELSIALLRQHK